jgi:hypothetical protein
LYYCCEVFCSKSWDTNVCCAQNTHFMSMKLNFYIFENIFIMVLPIKLSVSVQSMIPLTSNESHLFLGGGLVCLLLTVL